MRRSQVELRSYRNVPRQCLSDTGHKDAPARPTNLHGYGSSGPGDPEATAKFKAALSRFKEE